MRSSKSVAAELRRRVEQQTVLSQESGHVYVNQHNLRIWSHYTAEYQARQVSAQRRLMDARLSAMSAMDLSSWESEADRFALGHSQRGVNRYATVPQERALTIRPEWEYFKGTGLPDQFC